jgi:hypothetical protein
MPKRFVVLVGLAALLLCAVGPIAAQDEPAAPEAPSPAPVPSPRPARVLRTPRPPRQPPAAATAPEAPTPPAGPSDPRNFSPLVVTDEMGDEMRSARLANVRIEVAITDERGNDAPIKKSVMLTVADRGNGSVRSTSEQRGASVSVTAPLDIDAQPWIVRNNKIRLTLSLQYNFLQPTAASVPAAMEVKERFALLLENGKALVVSQSADPLSDRRVTLEVKATILQ